MNVTITHIDRNTCDASQIKTVIKEKENHKCKTFVDIFRFNCWYKRYFDQAPGTRLNIYRFKMKKKKKEKEKEKKSFQTVFISYYKENR